MDIIAAHREGLTQKLDVECADLAGRPGEWGQRAIVLHHLYDHSLGGHVWALLEAQTQMATDRALQALGSKVDAWWRRRSAREAARTALSDLRRAMGEDASRRTAEAYRAYRIAGTPAVSDDLSEMVDEGVASRLVRLHRERRDGQPLTAAEAEALALAVEADLGSDPGGAIAAAWAAIEATHLGNRARKAFATASLAKRLAKGRRKGWARIEKALREDPFLPAPFRANPAQHFYALQHGLADRRRKDWVEGESALAA